MLKATPHGTYVAGDNRIDFRLPTDIFDTSHFLLVRGIGYSGVRHDLDIVAFAGASSIDYGSPFFSSIKATDPTGVVFLKKKIGPHWQLFSDSVISKRLTQIEALQWTPAPKTEVAFAAGIGANKPFGAVSVNMSRPRFDLQAAYIAASQQFHRITVVSPLLAEPDKENILLTIRPTSFLSLTGTHQNYLIPQYPDPTNVRSAIDQGSASLRLFGTQLNGTVYHSSYDQIPFGNQSNHAVAFSAARDFTARVHLNSSYLVSKPKGAQSTNSLLSTVTEVITSRVSVSESITYSNGHTSVNFGGQFISNLLSFTANYDTFYVPADNTKPFQQALLLDVKLKVLGRLVVHGASFVDPTGRLRYTADANTVYSRNQAPSQVDHIALGRYILHGCVVDSDGAPVEGAAVVIDEKPVYTDSSGCFYLRENKPRTHKLSVVLSEFLVGGNWQITSMPTTITGALEENSSDAKVVVTVRRVRVISSNPSNNTLPSQSSGGATLK